MLLCSPSRLTSPAFFVSFGLPPCWHSWEAHGRILDWSDFSSQLDSLKAFFWQEYCILRIQIGTRGHQVRTAWQVCRVLRCWDFSRRGSTQLSLWSPHRCDTPRLFCGPCWVVLTGFLPWGSQGVSISSCCPWDVGTAIFVFCRGGVGFGDIQRNLCKSRRYFWKWKSCRESRNNSYESELSWKMLPVTQKSWS